MSNDNKKRIILPPKPESRVKSITEISSISPTETLIHDGISIIADQMAKFKGKTARGYDLDAKEARILHGHLDALVKLSREQRERDKGEEESLSGKSIEDLLKLLQESTEQEK